MVLWTESVAFRNSCAVTLEGLLPAPNVDSEDDVDQVKLAAPVSGLLGSGVATGVPCPGGKAARPDTCFMTHRYVTRMPWMTAVMQSRHDLGRKHLDGKGLGFWRKHSPRLLKFNLCIWKVVSVLFGCSSR